MRVLVIDDNPGDQALIEVHLAASAPEATMVFANNGKDGLNALMSGGVDVALVDHRLGSGGDLGTDLIRAARAQGCKVPIVLLTGFGDPNLDREAMAAGAADYLDKNRIEPAMLATTLRHAILRASAADELERQARRLAQQRAQLDLLRITPDGYLVQSAEGAVQYMNPTALRFLGNTDVSLVMPDEEGQSFEVTGADGVTRFLSAARVEMTWKSRPATLISLRDFTASVMAQRAAERGARLELVGRLAAGVAHDFNNHLTAIRGSLELAESSLPAASPAAEDIRLAIEATRRSSELSQRLLALGGRRRARAIPVDIFSVVPEAVRLAQHLVGIDASLTYTADDGSGWVLGRTAEVEELLFNLVSNARDAAGVNAQVRVSLALVDVDPDQDALDTYKVAPQQSGLHAVITIDDNGPGFAPDQLDRVFEPFFTTKPVGAGNGLGLAFVHQATRDRGGWLHVGRSPLGGARVQVGFPAISAPDEHAEPTPPAPTTARGRVLIVDDQPEILSILQRRLSQTGLDIVVAPDGDEALRLFSDLEGSFDVVLTDIVMPGLNGFELGRRIREQRPDVPIIYMSGFGEQAARVTLDRDEDEVPVMQKPFALHTLAAAVLSRLRSIGTVGSVDDQPDGEPDAENP